MTDIGIMATCPWCGFKHYKMIPDPKDQDRHVFICFTSGGTLSDPAKGCGKSFVVFYEIKAVVKQIGKVDMVSQATTDKPDLSWKINENALRKCKPYVAASCEWCKDLTKDSLDGDYCCHCGRNLREAIRIDSIDETLRPR